MLADARPVLGAVPGVSRSWDGIMQIGVAKGMVGEKIGARHRFNGRGPGVLGVLGVGVKKCRSARITQRCNTKRQWRLGGVFSPSPGWAFDHP